MFIAIVASSKCTARGYSGSNLSLLSFDPVVMILWDIAASSHSESYRGALELEFHQ
jgi:hypothetical protein